MYKENLELNKLKWLICHKTKQNQIIKSLTEKKKREKNGKEEEMEETE